VLPNLNQLQFILSLEKEVFFAEKLAVEVFECQIEFVSVQTFHLYEKNGRRRLKFKREDKEILRCVHEPLFAGSGVSDIAEPCITRLVAIVDDIWEFLVYF